MAESLTHRVKRIISGSAHALISAIEDLAPEAVMEEALREIDAATDEVRSELGRVVASKHLASKRLMEENNRHAELGGQIDVAVEQAREDLAKAAIAQQLDIEAQMPILEATISDAAVREKELEGYVTALLAKRREMQGELLAFREARRAEAVNVTEAAAGGQVGAKVRAAESAFDRMLSRQAGLPGMRSVADAKTAAQLAELENLSRDNRVEERLAQLKANRSTKE